MFCGSKKPSNFPYIFLLLLKWNIVYQYFKDILKEVVSY